MVSLVSRLAAEVTKLATSVLCLSVATPSEELVAAAPRKSKDQRLWLAGMDSTRAVTSWSAVMPAYV